MLFGFTAPGRKDTISLYAEIPPLSLLTLQIAMELCGGGAASDLYTRTPTPLLCHAGLVAPLL